MDASLLLPAEQAAAEARLALQAGRLHLEYLEEAVAAAERHKQQVKRATAPNAFWRMYRRNACWQAAHASSTWRGGGGR